MKRIYSWFSGLTIFVLAVLFTSSFAYADRTSQLESQFEAQLTTRLEPYGQPKATSYYDDLVDHYEQVMLMQDVIDQGIR